MIFNLYNISCKYVKPMNCMVLGNKQYNIGSKLRYHVDTVTEINVDDFILNMFTITLCI